jgi:hypothetical protein
MISELAHPTGNPVDTTPIRQYRTRGGITFTAEQIVPNVAVFARAGVANGQIEPYEYTDINQTVAGGLSPKGKPWGRPIRRVGNELIVECHPLGKDGEAVIGLQDLLAAGAREHSIADQDAQAPGIEVGLMQT